MSAKADIVAGIECALRRNGFFILERKWNDAGDCVIRFRAMMSPHHGFLLSHELLIRALDETREFADWMDGFIEGNRAGWAPLIQAMEN